jgi:hypothetical protein
MSDHDVGAAAARERGFGKRAARTPFCARQPTAGELATDRQARTGSAMMIGSEDVTVGADQAEVARRERRRKYAMICYGILCGVSVIEAFSTPVSLVWAAALGGYTFYLYRGGRFILWSSLKPRKRSRAWIYYAVIAITGLVLGFVHPAFLVVTVIAGAYAIYLYRGGRWVIWIW